MMARLGVHRGVRQLELFHRAQVPCHTPELHHYEGVAQRREAKAAPLPILWKGMGSWVREVRSAAAGFKWCDAKHRRLEALARLLDVEKIRACRHADDLRRVEQVLAEARCRESDLAKVMTRSQIGELLVETRNRLTILGRGRAEPKAKGPRLDPTLLPDEALARLIQSHRDLDLVARLRAERQRRFEAA
jgi:hypothetical protein